MTNNRDLFATKIKHQFKIRKIVQSTAFTLVATGILGCWGFGYVHQQDDFSTGLANANQVAQSVNSKITHQQIVKNQRVTKSTHKFNNDVGLSAQNLHVTKTKSNQLKDSIVGSIYIPSIDLKEPILSDDSNANLAFGAGMMADRTMGGHNNFALAGHNMKPYSNTALFSALNHVQRYDYVYTTDLNKIYIYEVTDKNVIKSDDTKMIDNHGTESNITLITCYNNGKQRLAVQGMLVGSKTYNNKYHRFFSFAHNNVEAKAIHDTKNQ